jgi:hypothetical protein
MKKKLLMSIFASLFDCFLLAVMSMMLLHTLTLHKYVNLDWIQIVIASTFVGSVIFATSSYIEILKRRLT